MLFLFRYVILLIPTRRFLGLLIGVNMKTIIWVKHYVHLQDIRSIFTNLETGEMLEKTYRNQCYIRNTNKLCEEPTEFFEVESFDGWDFYSGGFNLQDRELIGSYCCDGDGIVSVELLTDGSIHLNVQGSYMLDLSPNIEQAIEEATKYIKEEYPGIYEEFLNF